MSDHRHLFSPLELRSVRLRNRIGVSPMCMYSSEDGFANDWHLVHLGARAAGGAGLVIMEATAVSPEGRISPADMGIWSDAHVDSLRRCTQFIEDQGAVAGIQLAHAGRKASTAEPWKGGGYLDEQEDGWRPILAPSAIPFGPDAPTPQELDQTDIERLIEAFQQGAGRALEAGFRLVEIHAAHGYLLHEFLSPLSNHRTDAWGGSWENRTRLLREVVGAIREVWPDELPLLVRISATDWVEGGWDLDQSVELARMLAPLGVDLVDCSSGGTVPDADVPVAKGYQVDFATRIRSETGMPTAAVGLITEPAQAQTIIKEGLADLVLMAREFLRSPSWPLHAAAELGVDVEWPDQYKRAKLKTRR
ncbi:MAG: NADH:flavin oxidoreductase/NADH oxidase [Persicimonas sp.]